MTEIAYFIPHCDDGSCDLGVFYYKCPCCNKSHYDYSIWWKQYEFTDKPLLFNCESCDKPLTLTFDSEECKWLIN